MSLGSVGASLDVASIFGASACSLGVARSMLSPSEFAYDLSWCAMFIRRGSGTAQVV